MRCWAEINIDNLYKNIKELEKIILKEKIMAVIKANAYGHGMTEICKVLIKAGIKNFAVATVEEALKIKEINDEVTILYISLIFSASSSALASSLFKILGTPSLIKEIGRAHV